MSPNQWARCAHSFAAATEKGTTASPAFRAQYRAVLPPWLVPSIGAVAAALPGLVRPVIDAGGSEVPNHLAELLGQWRGGWRARRAAKREKR